MSKTKTETAVSMERHCNWIRSLTLFSPLLLVMWLSTGCNTVDNLPAGVPKGYALFYCAKTFSPFPWIIMKDELGHNREEHVPTSWTPDSTLRIAVTPGTHVFEVDPGDLNIGGQNYPYATATTQVLVKEGMITPVRIEAGPMGQAGNTVWFTMRLVQEESFPADDYKKWRERTSSRDD